MLRETGEAPFMHKKTGVAVAMSLLCVLAASCSSASSVPRATPVIRTPLPTFAAPTTTSPSPFTYRVVASRIDYDTSTKTFAIPVSVSNSSDSTSAIWCVAVIYSAPSQAMGVAGVRPFGTLRGHATKTVTVGVTISMSGAAIQVAALCGPSQKVVNNEYIIPINLVPEHNGIPLTTVCDDVQRFREDVLDGQQTGSFDTTTEGDATSMTADAKSFGPPFAAEAHTAAAAFKVSSTTSHSYVALDGELSTMLGQCDATGTMPVTVDP